MSTPNPTLNPLFLTVMEFARRIGVNRATATSMVKRGELLAVRIGAHDRIPASEIDRLLAGIPRPPVTGANTGEVGR